MRRDRMILGLATVVAGLLGSTPARAADEEVKAVEIAEKMTGVVDGLGRKETGTPVQGEQKAIVRDLDTLIASLERECQNCKGGMKRNRPTNGMDDSRISSGNGEMGPMIPPSDGGKDWGMLSTRERDRILQSMTEGFPPEYRTVLERYYRRLAEEKSAKAPTSRPETPGTDAKAKP